MAKKIINKNGTKNADIIEITKSNLKIKAGAGKDTITLTKGKKSFIYGDAGNDTFTINGGSSNNFYGGAGQRIRDNVAAEHRQFLQVLLLLLKIMRLREEFFHLLFIHLTICLGVQ